MACTSERKCLRGHALRQANTLEELAHIQGMDMYLRGYLCNVCAGAGFPVLHCNACFYDVCPSCAQLPEYCAAPRCATGHHLYDTLAPAELPPCGYRCGFNQCRGRLTADSPALHCAVCNEYMCPRCSGITEELAWLQQQITAKNQLLRSFTPPPKLGGGGAVKIAMFGQSGVGKSSFINTVARSARNRDCTEAVTQSAGSEGTIILEELMTDFNWHLVDTRGFFANDADEDSEFVQIMEGRIKRGEVIQRGGGNRCLAATAQPLPLMSRVHGVIFVVSATDERLRNGTHATQLDGPKRYLAQNGIKPVTVITHDDLLTSSAERLNAFQMASRCTGSSRETTFFVANYTKERLKRDPRTERQALLAVHAALVIAKQFIEAACQAAPATLTTRMVVTVTWGNQTFKYNCSSWYTAADLLRQVNSRVPGANGMRLVRQGTTLAPTECLCNHGASFELKQA
eukprot:TRINITY_DN9828_c0_g1_i1.p1 TRINITY_DN9828_c0_g1~~TRINITY_DN9828_c0_g1_i1.p1  ORF type:complete len:482 (-),score=108.72 TRINITY_DN9828_c0_g1_i1:183-1556(-)